MQTYTIHRRQNIACKKRGVHIYAWIDAYRDGYSISRLCRVVGVSSSGYCQWRTRPLSDRAQANSALDAEVAAIYKASRKSYGRPRIVAQLRSQGRCTGGERVRRGLKRQGLRPVYRRPYRVTTDSDHRLPVAPNMLERRFDDWSANQAWVSDITFIATGEGWFPERELTEACKSSRKLGEGRCVGPYSHLSSHPSILTVASQERWTCSCSSRARRELFLDDALRAFHKCHEQRRRVGMSPCQEDFASKLPFPQRFVHQIFKAQSLY